MKKIAFLDRDGTLNKDYPDQQWADIKVPELLEGTIEGLWKLKELGYELIVVTNQYIIHDGIITEEDYRLFTEHLISLLRENGIELLKIYCCPHNDQDCCICKKPKPGMIFQAMQDYEIDMNQSIYCGDSLCDQQLAKQMNLRFFGINMQGEKQIFHSIKDVGELLDKENGIHA